MLWLYACVIILALFAKQGVAEDKLIFSNVVWRHGARSTIHDYDVNPSNVWPQGAGQLTQIGMGMQYKLGEFLRKRYTGFLDESYKRVEIIVRSTDIDRTLMSAEANMAGLFKPFGSQKWNGTSTSWQPIPIHTLPVSDDSLLSLSCTASVGYKAIIKNIMSSQKYKDLNTKYKLFFKSIQRDSNFNVTLNMSTSWGIQDSIKCEKAQNVSMPSWVTPHVIEKLDEIVGLDMGIRFGGVGSEDRVKLAKYTGGYLVNEYINNMKDAVSQNATYKIKAYSAHDTTLSALLMAFNVYNWKQPPFASAILVELYQNASNSYFVKGFFRNSSKSLIPLKLFGCDYNCLLTDFIKLAQNIIPNEQDRQNCLITSPSDNGVDPELVIIGALFTILLCTWLGLVVVVCKSIYEKNKANHNEYEPVNDYIDSDRDQV